MLDRDSTASDALLLVLTQKTLYHISAPYDAIVSPWCIITSQPFYIVVLNSVNQCSPVR